MASKKEYLAFILDQLSEVNDITHRAMMGEFLLYHEGKVFGGIYDDRFLVKITPSSKKMLSDAEEQLPYEGAKPMLLVTEIDNRAFMKELIESMCSELPEPKKKAKRSR